MNAPQTLGRLLRSFFEDHLPCQKGLQPTTIRNYRDALVLYLRFVARERRCKLTRLQPRDLTCERVIRFLRHLETQRGNSVATRNQRLAALRSLFEYAAARRPEFLEEAQRLAAVPTKRMAPPRTRFLQRDEVEALFRTLPSSGPFSLRDPTLLLFLYNTGARVQEVVRLRVGHLELGASPRVHLHGKGDKWRICPLWMLTAKRLRELCCFPLYLVGSPRDLTGLFRRRISWDDGVIRDTSDRSEVAFVMNDCCRSGGDGVARAASVGKGCASAAHLSMPCPHGP